MMEEHFVHAYALEKRGQGWMQLKKELWTKDLDKKIDPAMHNNKDGWAIISFQKPKTMTLF